MTAHTRDSEPRRSALTAPKEQLSRFPQSNSSQRRILRRDTFCLLGSGGTTSAMVDGTSRFFSAPAQASSPWFFAVERVLSAILMNAYLRMSTWLRYLLRQQPAGGASTFFVTRLEVMTMMVVHFS